MRTIHATSIRSDGPRDASRKKLAVDRTELCPDELIVLKQIRASGGYISPSRLHRLYEAVLADMDAEFDEGGPLTLVIDRRVRVADLMGERVVARLLKAAQ